jgi:Na+-driven multidrug efflux pump
MASVEGGILRGQGRQHLGGIANVIVYWFIALPAGLALAFKADWGLYGLWAGMVRPRCLELLIIVTCIGTLCVYFRSCGIEK